VDEKIEVQSSPGSQLVGVGLGIIEACGMNHLILPLSGPN